MKRPTLDEDGKPMRKMKSLLKDVDEVEVVHKKKKKRKTEESISAEDETIVKRKKESNEAKNVTKSNSMEGKVLLKTKKKRKKEESRPTQDETIVKIKKESHKSQSETKKNSVEAEAAHKKKKKRKTEESILAEDETHVQMKNESLDSQGRTKNNSLEADATHKKKKRKTEESVLAEDDTFLKMKMELPESQRKTKNNSVDATHKKKKKRKTEESVIAEDDTLVKMKKESLESQEETKNNSAHAEAMPKKKKKGHGKGKTKKREDKKAKMVFESLLRKDSGAADHVAVEVTKEEEPVLDAETPEKTKNIKKKKKLKNADPGEHTEKPKPDTKELGICYLQTWKQNRENWHFQKARQLWLIRNLYNEESIDDENFSYLLEYLEGSKGGVRTRLLENAQAIHDTANDEPLKENSDDFVKLSRAKEILQFLSE